MTDYNLNIGINSQAAVQGANQASQAADRVTNSFGKATNSVDRKQQSLDRLKSAYMAAGKAMALYFAGRGLVRMIQGLSTANDNLAKMSQRLGITTEDLSVLAYQAELSGANFESAARGIQLLSRNMVMATQGTNEQSRAFDALGISLLNTDGSLRSSQAVMADLADRFSRMEDGATKTAVAMQIFGRSGAELIPLLNQGKDGLQGMADEAEKLGIVVGGDLAKASEIFNDNLSRVATTGTAFRNMLATELLPTLNNIVEGFISSEDSLLRMESATKAAGVAVKGLTSAFDILKGGISNTLTVIETLSGALTLLAMREFKLAKEMIADGWNDIANSGEEMSSRVDEVWSNSLEKMVAKAQTTSKSIEKDFKPNLATAVDVVEVVKSFKQIEDASDDMNNKILEGIRGFDSQFADSLNNMVWEADFNFANILKSFSQMITKMIIQAQVAAPIMQALTGFAGGLFPENMAGQSSIAYGTTASGESVPIPSVKPTTSIRPRAIGGIISEPILGRGVRSGSPYVFGEKGAERITPLNQNGGGSGSVKVEIKNESGQKMQVTKSTAEMDAGEMVVSVWIDAFQRNRGGLRDMLGA